MAKLFLTRFFFDYEKIFFISNILSPIIISFGILTKLKCLKKILTKYLLTRKTSKLKTFIDLLMVDQPQSQINLNSRIQSEGLFFKILFDTLKIITSIHKVPI